MTEIMLLVERAGRYAGHGIDHEDQPFHGELTVEALPGKAVALRFRSTGIDGTIYCDEHCTVALDEEGRLSLWALSSARDHCLQHTLRHGAPPLGPVATLVFGWGDPAEGGTDRSELAIDLWPDGEVGYRHAWGKAFASYAPRSSVKMSRVLGAESWST